MMDYDQYLKKFDSDPEDDDDPVIKQLKRNALFAEEEDGWVNLLPGFNRTPYNIEPVPPPPEIPQYKLDNGLQEHDRLVDSMKELTLRMAGASGKSYGSSETLSAPQSPRHNFRKPKQRSRASSRVSEASSSSRQSESKRHSKKFIHYYDECNNSLCNKVINNPKKAKKFTSPNENTINAENETTNVD